MTRRSLLSCVLLLALSAQPARSARGPAAGRLLLAGGGRLAPETFARFVALAGGPEADIVVIPTAAAQPTAPDRDWARPLRSQGAKRLTVLHAGTPEEASRPEFLAALAEAEAVWFTGGRQWRLADAYLDTPAHRALDALLARGGIIGGTSAGATAQADLMIRGDTSGNSILLGDHQRGFGWLTGAAVDQHLVARDRTGDLALLVAARPEVLGIGLREDAAVLIEGDVLTVLGPREIVIYDANTTPVAKPLTTGQRYHLADRAPLPTIKP